MKAYASIHKSLKLYLYKIIQSAHWNVQEGEENH